MKVVWREGERNQGEEEERGREEEGDKGEEEDHKMVRCRHV